MTLQPALEHDPPLSDSRTEPAEDASNVRDTLNDTPELRFLRDEIEALLGSATVRRTTREAHIQYADAEDTSEESPACEQDSEPAITLPSSRENVSALGKP